MFSQHPRGGVAVRARAREARALRVAVSKRRQSGSQQRTAVAAGGANCDTATCGLPARPASSADALRQRSAAILRGCGARLRLLRSAPQPPQSYSSRLHLANLCVAYLM